MQDKIRLGVIGTGMAWERLHWPALMKLTDKYEIAAVANKTVEKAQTFADSICLSADRVYGDYREMLLRPDIDAVDVLVPISENFEVARDVLNAGYPLIAEKPFASTLGAAQELINIKNSKKIPVLVAENFRYDEENKLIKRLLEERALGEPVGFVQVTGADFETEEKQDTFAAKEWRQHPDFPGGIFLDGGIHDMARLRFLFGNAAAVNAFALPHDKDYCPYAALFAGISFESGVSGQYAFLSAQAEHVKPSVGLRIYCSQGDIYLESKTAGKLRLFHKNGRTEELPFTPAKGYENELLNFYEALKNGSSIVSTPEEELGDLTLVYGILHAAEGRTTLSLN